MLTEERIREDATIRYADLQRFVAASPRLKRFMNSAEYNVALGTYERNGKPVSFTELQLILEAEQQRLSQRFEAATVAYLNGEISLEEWEALIIDESKTAFVIIALLVFGGASALQSRVTSPQVWSKTGDFLRAFLIGVGGFMALYLAGDRSPKQLQSYLRYKSRGVRSLHSELTQDARKQAGFNEGRRFLDPSADHCKDCPAYATNDWVAIDDIVPVGSRCACGGRCRCRVEYRFNPERLSDRLVA